MKQIFFATTSILSANLLEALISSLLPSYSLITCHDIAELKTLPKKAPHFSLSIIDWSWFEKQNFQNALDTLNENRRITEVPQLILIPENEELENVPQVLRVKNNIFLKKPVTPEMFVEKILDIAQGKK